ncbi:MAG: hypothetical protein DWQ44_10040 [Bacteroidetes bacterium]|nr:MAG: hypothetical protein DWQ33_10315 [Bacteroidota bacterium]REK06620.1 MAG: hypothetical protein DWQ39_03830 [Bacteroidota bacterium]REK33386.1 MAG: hypothetical protein DWQ44_10040 [Bacteroidota bacterium]REK49785.1 MAG: hypothetical protein DWQ48_06595 [Bacteroidota bacterium]
MKKIKSILAFVLIVSIVVSTGGIAVAAHLCKNKVDTALSFFDSFENCCGDSKDSCHKPVKELKKPRCCELKISYFKADLPSIINEPLKVNKHELISYSVFHFKSIFSFCNVSELIQYNTGPPKQNGGVNFLHFTGQLLI